MGRLRRAGYSFGVALTVFLYLSLPTLRQLYGPVVNVPVYAIIGLLAGGIAWVGLGKLSTDSALEKTALQVDADSPTGEDFPDDGDVDIGVDDEVERLRDER